MRLLDATQTVSVGDADETADAIDRILAECFDAGAVDRDLLHGAFARVAELYAGDFPGYLGCDMPYHDLRHSLDTALVMARLVDGYRTHARSASDAFGPEHALLGVLLALLHDSGLIRRTSEHALCGPQLMADHESRGVEFARMFLLTTSLRAYADLAPLVLATQNSARFSRLFNERDEAVVAIGHMLGSADLLSQTSDRYYLERCFYHLYPELVLGGYDRMRTSEGEERIVYRDAFDLLSKTPSFYGMVEKRLSEDFNGVARYLGAHFGGGDLYAEAIRSNLDRCACIIEDGDTRLLGPEPVTTTRDLAPIYHR